MSELSAAYVNVIASWTEGGLNSKKLSCKRVAVTVPSADATAYGDGSNTIPAGAFNLSSIVECSNAINASDKLVVCLPSATGAVLYTFDANSSTAANQCNIAGKFARASGPADETYYLVVKGVA